MASQIFILKDRVGIGDAAKIIGKSEERIRQFCKEGLFSTARKGPGRNGRWTMGLDEVRCNSTLELRT
jgi:hypothetical protein